MKRITKHEFYMGMAILASARSYCTRNQVGAVIVKGDNIISYGYNGTISGMENYCDDKDGSTKKEVLHAESNAIAKCSRSVNSSEGATLYCTLSPCFDCAKMIIQAGITEVYYKDSYRDSSGIFLLLNAGIKVEMIS
jgi:dCMP deaminase